MAGRHAKDLRNKLLALPGIEARVFGRPAHNLVAIPTVLVPVVVVLLLLLLLLLVVVVVVVVFAQFYS